MDCDPLGRRLPGRVTRFSRFAAIDWSGEAVARPRGLALALAETGSDAPLPVRPAGGWSREALGDWIAEQAGENMLIGIDLSTAFPFIDSDAYFPGWHASPGTARELWALVEQLSADDPHLGCSSFVDHPEAARHGNVAKFMQRDAQEHEQDEHNRLDGRSRAPGEIVRNADPGEEDQEGDVQPDIGACNPADGE